MNSDDTDRTTDAVPRAALAVSALLAGLCPLLANSLEEGPEPAGTAVLASAAAGLTTAGRASLALFLVAFAALVVALACLATLISSRSPVLAGVVAVAGAAAIAVKLAEAQTGMALRASAEVVDPGTASVLTGIDEAGFVVYGFLFSLALGAASLGLLRSGSVPRWHAWWGVVAGALGVLTAAIGVVWAPNYVPIPFLLLLVWLVALGILAVRRPLRGRTEAARASTMTV